jgi:hypothetical protein
LSRFAECGGAPQNVARLQRAAELVAPHRSPVGATERSSQVGARVGCSTPTWILDTRTGAGGVLPAAGAVVSFSATGVAGVPSVGVSAVVLNVTITEASAVGFVQVFPTGRAVVRASSNLNVEHTGQTIPNLVVVPVSDSGQVSIFT